MPWDKILQKGTACGVTFLLDILSFDFLNGFINESSEKLVNYLSNAINKGDTKAIQQFAVEFAGCGKLMMEKGPEPIQKAVEVITKNPSLLEKEGSIAEMAKKFIVTTPDFSTIINSAKISKKGGESVVGHALQKHAGRHPEIWNKVKGNADMINSMALDHLQEILDAPGYFVRVKNKMGIEFLEKRLADGRGIRLNLDKTFKGFID